MLETIICRKFCIKCGVEYRWTKEYFFKERDILGKLRLSEICRNCGRGSQIRYAQTNREKILQYQKEYRKNNSQKLIKFSKNWRETNSQQIKEKKKKYYQKNKKEILIKGNRYKNSRYQTDVSYRLLENMRTRLRAALKENWKSGHTVKLLGCSIEFFKQWLERQFKEGMNWKNQGKECHIDHILTCASFDLQNSEEQEVCFHYTNLQPLWVEENLSKKKRM
jgi:hypothetical protein